MARRRFPLSLQIVSAMALGLIVGPLLGAHANPLGELGRLCIQLIKAVATPLVFFAIVNAIVKTELKGKAALRLGALSTMNACLALGLGLLLSNLFAPGSYLDVVTAPHPGNPASYADRRIDLLKTFAGIFPVSVVQPFAENLILAIVVVALLFGFALRKLRAEADADPTSTLRRPAQVLEDASAGLQRVLELALRYIIALIPLAVFGVVARTIAEHGFAPLRGLAAYLVIGLLGLALHIGVTYQLLLAFYARMSLRRFWAEAKEPVVYAMGANSSLATLPITLRALDRLGVSRSSSALGACVGTNFNNDGIILYEGMAVLFVAQAHGMHLGLGQQLLAAGACLVAAMGVAGVPEAGFISLALVLNTVGLPVEILPLLLTVDWVLGRARSVTNVLSDMVLSILIDGRRPSLDGPVLSPPGRDVKEAS